MTTQYFRACLVVLLLCLPGLAGAQQPAAVTATANFQDLDKLVMPLPRISPRPDFVAGVERSLLSLNGKWRFSPEGSATEKSKQIDVPGEWAMQGFAVPTKGFAEYLLSFDIPADWKGQSLRLRFDAVSTACKVLLNGQEVGEHDGGFVPFELDVTKAARVGSKNELRVKVQCESMGEMLNCTSQYAAHQVGGILRKVTLFALPPAQVAEQFWQSKFDAKFVNATLTVKSVVDAAGEKVLLRHELLGAKGNVVSVWEKADANGEVSLSQEIKSPAHWTNETPNLYRLRTTLLRDGKALESFSQTLGFRDITVSGGKMLINGKPVKLLGACHHEIHPLLGRAENPALSRRDVELFREANFNLLRTSHYPPSEEFLAACDELGILVEDEAALCWVGYSFTEYWKDKNNKCDDPQYFPMMLRANLDNVAANRNHASVIIWSLANESMWTRSFEKINQLVNQIDPTRPATFHDQNWGSYKNRPKEMGVAVWHYPQPGVFFGKGPEDPRAVYFGEYAHVECYNYRELATDPFIRADWGRVFEGVADGLWAKDNYLGGSIWSGVDDLFHLPDGNVVGYGEWGVIDGWRRKKPEWYGVKRAYTPVRMIAANGETALVDGKLKLNIQNRYNFTDLADVAISWSLGNKRGDLKIKLAPHAKGEVEIPVAGAANGDKLVVSVQDPRGFEAIQQSFLLGKKADINTAPMPVAGVTAKLSGAQTDKPVVVNVGNKTYSVDRSSGKLAISVDGKKVLSTPLALMLLSLNNEGGKQSPAGRQFVNKAVPYTEVCADHKVESVTATEQDGTVNVVISDSYDMAKGSTTLAISGTGVLVSYQYAALKDYNLRQWGLVLNLPGNYQHLKWLNDEGEGDCRANPLKGDVQIVLRKDVSGTDWWQDANALGTNLFRATKPDVLRTSLDNGEYSVTLNADGLLHTRAWVNGSDVRLLAAGSNTGGADQFFAPYYNPERRIVKKGEQVAGKFWLNVNRVGK